MWNRENLDSAVGDLFSTKSLYSTNPFSMAILKGSGNDEYEVRIKRYPEKTYFDEYIKTGDREKPGAASCDRYMVGEDGARYTIEVTLKKGFRFGEFDLVQAQLLVPGKVDSVCHKDIRRPAATNTGRN